ncbi:MAG: cysteine hydrolase, partial [Leptolyngbyaceae cyanobacterium CRU_2_3]|nr:cysteine hydrolase [Leptolyngbyaceae cyanobacterium CRU_2_3]
MYCYTHNRDKTDLPPTFDSWLDPTRTAILCIDMHRGHLQEEATCPAPRAIKKIEVHNIFHRQARELNIPIIMVQHWQRHGGIDDVAARKRTRKANWRYLYELYMPPNPLMDHHSWEG